MCTAIPSNGAEINKKAEEVFCLFVCLSVALAESEAGHFRVNLCQRSEVRHNDIFECIQHIHFPFTRC
jgi:hypothetical protein